MPTPGSPLSPAGALATHETTGGEGTVKAALTAAFDELLGRELEAGDLTTAWELVERARFAEPTKARPFFFVLAALFEARRQGHTRLTLPCTWPRESAQLFDGWELNADDQQSVLRFVVEELAPPKPRSPGLAQLLGGPDEGKPLVRLFRDSAEVLTLAFQRDVAKERRLARSCLTRMGANTQADAQAQTAWTTSDVERALAMCSEGRRPLVPEQRRAVVRALTRRIALIAGGPGTGKTTIILSLVRTAITLGLEPALIGLAAPTGKAARRIEEALADLEPAPGERGIEATTLHGLLGLGPSLSVSPQFHAEAPLPHRLVIVDEASMIGLDGLDLLFEAMAPEATLVLLGDPDQLPSVEAGGMFRALVEAPALDAIRLTESHRMRAEDPAGATILRIAQEVKEGRWPPSVPVASREGDLPDKGVHRIPLGAMSRAAGSNEATEGISDAQLRSGLARFFARWRAQHLGWQAPVAEPVWSLPTRSDLLPTQQDEMLRDLLAVSINTRLLAVTRGSSRPTGVAAVNDWFHADWARSQAAPGSKTSVMAPLTPRFLPGVSSGFLPGFLPGEPVMVTENDAEKGLANGDTGMILRVRAGRGPSTLAVVFPRRERLAFFSVTSLERNLVLAYAVTVHKAQGSEHEHVALLLPPDDLLLFGRELLYTALTRARRSVLLIGDESRAAQAAARATLRKGMIGDWLTARDATL